jgi:hypothetical protein
MKVLVAAVALACALNACEPHYIDGSHVEDTPDNRSIWGVLALYKSAVEDKNMDALLSLVSKRYYEDNGNADPADDYGYNDLQAKVLPQTFNHLKDVRVELEVKDIKVQDDKAHADVRFTYQAKMALPAGEKWSADAEINRIDLAREQGQWKIVSGL